MKTKYTMQSFPELKAMGNELEKKLQKGRPWYNPLLSLTRKDIRVTCPECGKRHCYVRSDDGVFRCWSCNAKGILADIASHCPKSPKRKKHEPKNEVPLLPTDFTAVEEKYLENCWKVYEPQSVFGGQEQFNDTQLAAQRYLNSLHISRETALKAGLYCGQYYMEHNGKRSEKSEPCLVYATYLGGKIINLKMRSVALDSQGKVFKSFDQVCPNKPAAPYHIDCINPATEPAACEEGKDLMLIITEGEKDTLTLLECGFPKVISVPNGAMADVASHFEAFQEWIQEAGDIVICGDSDHAGRILQKHLSDYFGGHVSIVQLPQGCKDISEVYAAEGKGGVERCIATARPEENPDIVTVGSIFEEAVKVCLGDYDHGYSIGYGPYTDRHLWLTSEGGLIVVTGRPNAGKTDWMRCTLAHLMLQQGKGCVFCSFEEHIKEKHVRRLVQLMYGCRMTEQIPRELIQSAVQRLDGLMVHLVMKKRRPTATNIIRLTEECIARYDIPVGFLIIDPYLFLQSEHPSESETQQIKQLLTELQAWGREMRIWVVVVAHPRKLVKDGSSEYEEIDEYTIAGSAHWANLADFLLSVKRVTPGLLPGEEQSSEAPSYTQVSVLKVRDQDLCSTGRMFFVRQPSGRYDERLSAEACKREIEGQPPLEGELRPCDTNFWNE